MWLFPKNLAFQKQRAQQKLIPKRGQSKFPITLVGKELFDLFSSKCDHALDIVEYMYVWIDWRACPNILFTTEELESDRGNIIVIFW